MNRHSREENAPDLDYSERAGFLVGKAAKLADWLARKESAQYARLFARLRWRKRYATAAHKAWVRAYIARPEVKARCAAHFRAWSSKPKVKAAIAARMYAYRRTPEYRAREKELRRRPESKAKVAAYNKAYFARPEVKARKNERQRAAYAAKKVRSA